MDLYHWVMGMKGAGVTLVPSGCENVRIWKVRPAGEEMAADGKQQ